MNDRWTEEDGVKVIRLNEAEMELAKLIVSLDDEQMDLLERFVDYLKNHKKQ